MVLNQGVRTLGGVARWVLAGQVCQVQGGSRHGELSLPDGPAARGAVPSGQVIRFARVLPMVATETVPTNGRATRSDHTPRSDRCPRRAFFLSAWNVSDNRPMVLNANAVPRNLTLAITGASGSVYAVEILKALEADVRVARVNLEISDSALRVLAEELEIRGRADLVERLLGRSSNKIEQQGEGNIGANIASGSYPSDGMVVLPCSMGTLAGIANGMASNLIERAADVCLKERRPLLLCVRETPFNRIHLRNMQLASDAGAVIFPVMPTLYNKPQSTGEMALQFVQRVLAHVGLPQNGAFVWSEE